MEIKKELFVNLFPTLLAREANLNEATIDKVARNAILASSIGDRVFAEVFGEPGAAPTDGTTAAQEAPSAEKKKRGPAKGAAKGLPAPSEAAGQ